MKLVIELDSMDELTALFVLMRGDSPDDELLARLAARLEAGTTTLNAAIHHNPGSSTAAGPQPTGQPT